MTLTSILTDINTRTRAGRLVAALTGNTNKIDSVTVTAGGSGYTSTPTVAFSGSHGATATATITGGSVTGVSVTASGSGYPSGTAVTVTFSGGGGSGAGASVTLAATTLDAIPTATLPVGTTVGIVIGGIGSTYLLSSGTNATATPTIVRPYDYDGTLNAKIWTLVQQGNSYPVPVTLTDGATITATVSPYGVNSFIVTLGGNRTLAFSGLSAGTSGVIEVIQDATGSRTLTLPANSKVAGGGGGTVTLTTTANAIDVLRFFSPDGTKILWDKSVNYT